MRMNWNKLSHIGVAAISALWPYLVSGMPAPLKAVLAALGVGGTTAIAYDKQPEDPAS